MIRLSFRAIVLASPLLAVTSCSTVKSVGAVTANGFSKAGTVTANGFSKAGSGISDGLAKVETFSIRDLMPSRVKVVEVREKDLKPMPLGRDLALAYQDKQKKRGFWSSFTGREYKEPTLPNQPEELDGTLLPPL